MSQKKNPAIQQLFLNASLQPATFVLSNKAEK